MTKTKDLVGANYLPNQARKAKLTATTGVDAR